MMQKTFTIQKHDAGVSSANIIRAIAAIFADEDRTLTDLAGMVNPEIDFPPATPK